ncbi:MAG: hypothetical protein B7Z80_19930 [Rhodospirillales bacterium 20-64-7]|nr:MAG: hypothetical protein B7Z80_19930 [Rhodospirillales bacterium 20-64-7]
MVRCAAARPAIQLDELKHVLKCLPRRKAPGLDHWRPGELRQLPDEALRELIDFYHACEAAGRWPQALRQVRVALLPTAANALGVGRSSVYCLIKAGKLEAIKIGRRTLLTTASIKRLVHAAPSN